MTEEAKEIIENYKRVRVTLTQDYLFDSYISDDNIKDWFLNFNINQSHAARDGSEIGGGKRLIDFKFVPVVDSPHPPTDEELEQEWNSQVMKMCTEVRPEDEYCLALGFYLGKGIEIERAKKLAREIDNA